jgi:short subunit dehydrogenase-like uncharacterized protein
VAGVNDPRDLDVVVFGATGFVGRLLARYLTEHAPAGLRVGLAGRSEERLAALRSELGSAAADWTVATADSGDQESLAVLARRSRAIATTVGPYRQHGLPLVEACIEAGTDYADLTGEVLFMHETTKRHERAEAAGAKIVHACGFDSIPSDLGVLLLHEAAHEDGAGELEETTLIVKAAKGGFSGGTIASLKGQLEEIKSSPALKRIVDDPYALSPNRGAEPSLGSEPDLRGLERSDDAGGWIGPFVMASTNTRVVRRSNALQDWAYGRRFRYREVTAFGSGPAAPVKGAAMTGGLAALQAGLDFKPTSRLLDRVLPDPGEGPSEDTQRKGLFRIEVHGHTSAGAHLRARIGAQGDPGYAATSVMLGESALCLALDREELPARTGVLTPATAMGTVLVDRLRAAGHTYEVDRIAGATPS